MAAKIMLAVLAATLFISFSVEALPWDDKTPEGTQRNLCYGVTKSSVQWIKLDDLRIKVWCDVDAPGEPWIVILNRKDGSVDFNRTYIDYIIGFGEHSGEYWIGLEALYKLTKNKQAKLRIDLEKFGGTRGDALYDRFWIGDRKSGYQLEEMGGYSLLSTAGDMNAADGLLHREMKFSTWDNDKDTLLNNNCAEYVGAGWWFNQCYQACLTCPIKNSPAEGPLDIMSYLPFTDNKRIALKSASMKIKLPYHLA